MNNTTIPFDTTHFLQSMKHRSFAFVGATMLLRAHLVRMPGNRLSRAEIYVLFHVRSGPTLALIDDVIDLAYRADDEGRIYSPAIDRAMLASEPAGRVM